jgi:hypothetical protein
MGSSIHRDLPRSLERILLESLWHQSTCTQMSTRSPFCPLDVMYHTFTFDFDVRANIQQISCTVYECTEYDNELK